MKIIQQYRQAKTGKIEDCEDEIVVTDDFVAVFDGATAKTSGEPKLYDGKTAGQVAAKALADALPMIPADSNRKAAVVLLNSAIDIMYDQYGIKKAGQSTGERFTASGIIYSKKFHEIWVVGDCPCRYGSKTYRNENPVDSVTKQARAMFVQHALMTGQVKPNDLYEKDLGRDFIMPLLQRQYTFANAQADCEFAYPVFNGFGIDVEMVKRHSLTPEYLEIILASDGYPELSDSLEETEKYLEKMLETDPHCIKSNKGTKGIRKGNISYDDRSYIRFRVTN